MDTKNFIILNPSLFFVVQKLSDAVFLDKFQVFNHAHPIPGFVSFIQISESFAGILFAGN
jgi:hypothetical protein